MQHATITDLLRTSVQEIAESASARLDAEVLLAHALRCDRSRLYARGEVVPAAEDLDRFKHLIEKRKAGQPVAYLTGVREFWSLPLEVNPHTLIPRPETECLVERALQLIPEDRTFNVADLGTGSGAIALALAKERPTAQILATDIDEQTLATAARNFAAHRVENITLCRSNWFESIGDRMFDLIVSNPPYIPENDPHLSSGDVRFEPRLALSAGYDGMAMLDIIIEHARHHLLPGGWLLLEHGYDQGDRVNKKLNQFGYSGFECLQDLAGRNRATLAQWTR
ncbi:MAG: peptide chain release factor N(5)-glutamine methyltransferase [Gammaproteobacteria bacterium]|nr:peptide chain release factor N(5)-glutamine methyltransferase [Gammaproteobacteria bacterium]